MPDEISSPAATDTTNGPPEYRIRRAQSDDAPGLAALLRSMGLFRRMQSESPEETLAYLSRSLEQSLADASHSIHLAHDEAGVPVGYVAVHWLPYLILAGEEGFVSELFIAEASRGRGIGSRLLDCVVAEARERGCSRLHLINFRERESYRRGFYSRLGWEERPDAADFVLTLG